MFNTKEKPKYPMLANTFIDGFIIFDDDTYTGDIYYNCAESYPVYAKFCDSDEIKTLSCVYMYNDTKKRYTFECWIDYNTKIKIAYAENIISWKYIPAYKNNYTNNTNNSTKIIAELTNKINRLEIIDNNRGREYVSYDVKSLTFSLQDDNKTLKIFKN